MNNEESSPELEEAENSDEFKLLGMVGYKEFITYIGAAIYGYWENARAMAFDAPGVIDNKPEELARATEGFQKLLDQNTGDGTIVALGFLGAEALTLSMDKLAKKLGKKGIDPTIRFLSSLAFGVGLATYLETTTIMNNTVDIPGDLFGVGLGAAFILTSKLVAEHVNVENMTKLSEKTKKIVEEAPKKFQEFSKAISIKIITLNEDEDENITAESTAESISMEFVDLIDKIPDDSENLNLST